MPTKSTAGRHALPAPTAVDVEMNADAVAVASQAATDLGRIVDGVTHDQVAFSQRVGELLGRRKLLAATAKLVTVTDLLEIQQIKSSKEYKDLRLVTPAGASVTVTTWADFCEHVVGASVEKVDLDLSNLAHFGADMLESFQQLGIGYRQMRDLRAVPMEAREALTLAAQAGDPKAMLEAAEDLIERHAAERKTAEKALAKAEQAVAAKNRVIEAKADKITELETELGMRAHASLPEREQAQLDLLRDATLEVELALVKLMAAVDEVTAAAASEAVDLSARQSLDYCCRRLVEQGDQRGIFVDLAPDAVPIHMQAIVDMGAEGRRLMEEKQAARVEAFQQRRDARIAADLAEQRGAAPRRNGGRNQA